MIPLRDDNPTRSVAVVTLTLIAANILVFVHEWRLGLDALELFIQRYGLIPALLTHGGGWQDYGTVVSSMFLHGGLLHLAGNMLYLWIFGNNIEEAVGHGRFVLFYLLCGVGAAAAQIAVEPLSTVPMIGASGAVSGVLGAYLLLYPRARVLVLIPIWIFLRFIEVRAIWLLLFWFGLQLLSGMLAPKGEAGVAFWAHIGGFVAGLALIPLFKQRHVRLWAGPRRR